MVLNIIFNINLIFFCSRTITFLKTIYNVDKLILITIIFKSFKFSYFPNLLFLIGMWKIFNNSETHHLNFDLYTSEFA